MLGVSRGEWEVERERMKWERKPGPAITEKEEAKNPCFQSERICPKGGNEQEGKMSRSSHPLEGGSGIWKGERGRETIEKEQCKKYNRQISLFLYH